jgi:predicted nucleic acid-binding Zn ribbon protein
MHCPKCQIENPEGSTFCRECGAIFQHASPQCGKAILPDDKFCNTCGHNLKAAIKAKPEDHPREKPTPTPSSKIARKYITDTIQLFGECENDFSQKQAREAPGSL